MIHKFWKSQKVLTNKWEPIKILIEWSLSLINYIILQAQAGSGGGGFGGGSQSQAQAQSQSVNINLGGNFLKKNLLIRNELTNFLNPK